MHMYEYTYRDTPHILPEDLEYRLGYHICVYVYVYTYMHICTYTYRDTPHILPEDLE